MNKQRIKNWMLDQWENLLMFFSRDNECLGAISTWWITRNNEHAMTDVSNLTEQYKKKKIQTTNKISKLEKEFNEKKEELRDKLLKLETPEKQKKYLRSETYRTLLAKIKTIAVELAVQKGLQKTYNEKIENALKSGEMLKDGQSLLDGATGKASGSESAIDENENDVAVIEKRIRKAVEMTIRTANEHAKKKGTTLTDIAYSKETNMGLESDGNDIQSEHEFVLGSIFGKEYSAPKSSDAESAGDDFEASLIDSLNIQGTNNSGEKSAGNNNKKLGKFESWILNSIIGSKNKSNSDKTDERDGEKYVDDDDYEDDPEDDILIFKTRIPEH